MKKKSIFILICFIIISIFIFKNELNKSVGKKTESNSSTIVLGDNLITPTDFIFLDARKVDPRTNPYTISSKDRSMLSVDIIDSTDLKNIKSFYSNKPLTLMSEVEFNELFDQFGKNEDHNLTYTLFSGNTVDQFDELSDTHYFFSDGCIKESGEFYQSFVKGEGTNTERYYVKGKLDENEIQYINQAYAESYSLKYSE